MRLCMARICSLCCKHCVMKMKWHEEYAQNALILGGEGHLCRRFHKIIDGKSSSICCSSCFITIHQSHTLCKQSRLHAMCGLSCCRAYMLGRRGLSVRVPQWKQRSRASSDSIIAIAIAMSSSICKCAASSSDCIRAIAIAVASSTSRGQKQERSLLSFRCWLSEFLLFAYTVCLTFFRNAAAARLKCGILDASSDKGDSCVSGEPALAKMSSSCGWLLFSLAILLSSACISDSAFPLHSGIQRRVTKAIMDMQAVRALRAWMTCTTVWQSSGRLFYLHRNIKFFNSAESNTRNAVSQMVQFCRRWALNTTLEIQSISWRMQTTAMSFRMLTCVLGRLASKTNVVCIPESRFDDLLHSQSNNRGTLTTESWTGSSKAFALVKVPPWRPHAPRESSHSAPDPTVQHSRKCLTLLYEPHWHAQ